jgi:hypothetical protein
VWYRRGKKLRDLPKRSGRRFMVFITCLTNSEVSTREMVSMVQTCKMTKGPRASIFSSMDAEVSKGNAGQCETDEGKDDKTHSVNPC